MNTTQSRFSYHGYLEQKSGKMSLYGTKGERKYLTREERDNILAVSDTKDGELRTFVGVLAFTGCRISEALALTVDRVDLDAGLIIFESLKKRTKGVYRAVPVPPPLLDTLNLVHHIRQRQQRRKKDDTGFLWVMARNTAWRHVKAVMDEAGLANNPAATPKGLRHCFGVTAVSAGISLNMVQKWLGHAQLSTTAIYADAMGDQERQIASKMWG